MRMTRFALTAALGLCSTGLIALSASAEKGSPAPGAATPAADGKTFEDDPPGTEQTPAPTLDEWRSAERVKIARADGRCNAYRVREWLKVHCSFPAAGVAQMAGSSEGVAVWVDRTSMDIEQVAFKPRGVDIIFPVRRGDARYFELFEWFADYMFPSGQFVSVSISEQWPEGEPGPIITM